MRTKRSRALALALTAALLSVALVEVGAPAQAAVTSAVYPGGVWADSQGRTIQAHGGGVIKAGNTYYWFGEDKTNGYFYEHVSCYSSPDLVHWTFVNNVLSQQPSGDLAAGRIVERPHVIYNSSTATYVMYMHIDSWGYGTRRTGVATSSSVCGDYTYRGSMKPLGHDILDQTLFKDTDGTAYLIGEDRTNVKLQIYRLSADYLTPTTLVATLPQYEAPAMVKINGRYYLFASHLTGWATNDNQYTTATSLAGPWSAWQSFATGTGNTFNSQTTSVLPIQGTNTTTYMWMGDRWDASATPLSLANSRYLWLPLNINGTTATMNWVGGWTINPATGGWGVVSGTTYEAESGANTLTGTARSHACGSGTCIGYLGGGAANTLTFNNVKVPFSGPYDVILHYGNGDRAPRTATVKVDGTVINTGNFPPSGGVTSIKFTANFTAGNNTVFIGNDTTNAPDVDKIQVVGTGAVVTVDDSVIGTGPGQFNYVGANWAHGPATGGAYNDTNSWNHSSNQYVTVAFAGTQIKLFGVKSPVHGIGAVSIDGGAETKIDFYTATRIGNQLMWTSPALTAGAHTMKLRVTGTRNPLSGDSWVVPDRVDITP